MVIVPVMLALVIATHSPEIANSLNPINELANDRTTATVDVVNMTLATNVTVSSTETPALRFEDIYEDDFDDSPAKPAEAIFTPSTSSEIGGGCNDPQFVQNSGNPSTLLVWSYYDTDSAPEPVHYFQESWRKNINTAPENFHHVTPSNLRYYLSPCDLPPNFNHVESRSSKSDLVRVALIWRYGGVYLDVSTVVYPAQGRGINDMWSQIVSGTKTAAACHDSGMPHKYDYLEDYFLMAQRGNPVFSEWHSKQLEVFGSRSSSDGIVHDNQWFYVDREFKWMHKLDYFALSNLMMKNLGARNYAVAEEINNRWILLDWNRCLENQFRLLNSKKTLLTPLNDDELRELNGKGVGAFDKFTTFRLIKKDFADKYSDMPDRGAVMSDRTSFRVLMQKARVA